MRQVVLGRTGKHNVAFDLDILLRTRLLIQANSGGGKSYILRRLAEQLFGKVQVFLIDRDGEFASLREKYDYLHVGQGGDTPADVRSARALAEKLLELRVSAVFDLYEAFRSKPSDRRAWVRNFLEGVMDAPKKYWRPLIVFVDEAHLFCPESVPKAASMIEREIISGCKEAMISLATAGRKRGFCAVWATQRLAKLDKDATAELLNRLVGMTIEDVDVDRAADLMSVSKGERAEFKLALKKLEPGNFYAFGRAICNERVLVKVGPVETTHPEPGSPKHADEPPPAPEAIRHLLPKLSDFPKEVETRAKTEAELRAEVKALKAKLAARPVEAPKTAAPKPAVQKTVLKEIPVAAPKDIARIERAVATAERASEKFLEEAGVLRGFADKVRAGLAHAKSTPPPAAARQRPAIPPPVRPAAPRPAATEPSENGKDLDKAQRAILSILCQYPEGCVAGKLTLLTGYRMTGGFRNALAALRTKGYMVGENLGTMTITQPGMDALGSDYQPLPEGPALVRYWREHRSFGVCAKKALAVLLDNPDGLDINALAEASGYQVTGGFRNALADLRTAGVMVGKNTETMRACPELLNLALEKG